MKRWLWGLLALLLSAPAVATRLVVLADLNGRYGSSEYSPRVAVAIARTIALAPDAVLIAGDMVAGQRRPALSDAELERMWAAFNQTVSEPLAAAGIPLLITPGNHDASVYAGFERDRQQFMRQWQHRAPQLPLAKGSRWPLLYGAWVGDTLVVSIDGNRVGALPDAERAALAQLLNEQAGRARNVLLLAHLPLWPIAQGREREIIDDAALRELLAQRPVDYWLSGHHHAYYSGVDRAGTIHLAVGALGGNVRRLVGQRARQPFSFALLDLCPEGARLAALSGPDFSQTLAPAQLPLQLSGPAGTLPRAQLPTAEPERRCATATLHPGQPPPQR